MKRLNTWLNKSEELFKFILDKPASMNILLGFVLGAILPTYALLVSNKVQLGDVGEWLGAIATFFAVWVSLYLANKNSKAKLKIRSSTRDPYRMEVQPTFDIVNLGSVSASVRVEIKITNGFVKKMLACYDDGGDKIQFYHDLTDELDLMVSDINGDIIKPYNRLEIGQHNSIVVRVDSFKIINWLVCNSPIIGKYDIEVVVEDIDGTRLKKLVSRNDLMRLESEGGAQTKIKNQ